MAKTWYLSHFFIAFRTIMDPQTDLALCEKKSQTKILGQNTPTYQLKQEVYVPRQEAIEIIKRIEQEAKNRIEQYKQFTLQLKQKYDLYEKESDEYYQQIITEQRAKVRAQIKEKEDLLAKLKQEQALHQVDLQKLSAKLLESEQQSELFQDQNLKNMILIEQKQDQIDDLESKLDKLQEMYTVLSHKEPEVREVEKIVYVEKEEDNYVDPDEMISIQKKRSDHKQMLIFWYQQFERDNGRAPELKDFEQCKDQLDQYLAMNRAYTDCKFRLMRVGKFEEDLNKFKPKPILKEIIREEIYIREEAPKIQQESALSKRSHENQRVSPKAEVHEEIKAIKMSQQQKQNFFDEPVEQKPDNTVELLSLKQQIEVKEQRNNELLGQISRLEVLIGERVNENQLLLGLQNELNQKKALIDQRDDRINQLIHQENLLEEQKQGIIKDLEKARKINNLLQNENITLKEQIELQSSQPIVSKKEMNKSKQSSLHQSVKSLSSKSIVSEKSDQQEQIPDIQPIINFTQPQFQQIPEGYNVQNQQQQQIQQIQQQQIPSEANKEMVNELKRIKKENKKLQEQIEILKKVQNQQPQIIEKYIEREPTIQKSPKIEQIQPTQLQQIEKKPSEKVIPQPEPYKEVEPKIIIQIDTKQVDELKALNEVKEKQIHKLTESYHELQSQLELFKSTCQAQSSQASVLQAQADAFQNRIQKKKEKVQKFKTEKSNLEQNLKSLSLNKDQEINFIKQRYEEQIQQHELEIQSLKREQLRLQQNGQSSIQGLQDQHQKDIQNLIQSHQAEIGKREESINAYRVQLEKLEKSRIKMQDKLTDLEIELEKKSKSEVKLTAKIEELSKIEIIMQQQFQQLSKIAGEATSLKEERETLISQLEETRRINEDMEVKYKEEQKRRKQLHNELEDSKGQIRLYCRVRPLTRSELEREESKDVAIKILDEMNLVVHGKNQSKSYTFDSVFGPNSNQEQVFEESKRLVQSSIDGFNVCIFAYGQTGSGKTFTIQGNQAHPGLTPRAIDELFGIVSGMSLFQIELRCYMVELYKDEIRDLLLPKNAQKKPLEVKDSATGMVVINGVTEVTLGSIEEANRIFNFGLDHRMTRATKMNEASSRSHLIYSIIIDSRNTQTRVRTIGKLSFVDLAGSESAKKTGTDKDGQEEAKAINKSLSALGNVIEALSKGSKHIPYRDSTLTKVMKDSLGGTAKTLMFVNVSPSIYNESESKNSMDYATRVKKIKNQVKINVETRETSHLKQMVVQLENALEKYKEVIMRSNMASELDNLRGLLSSVQFDQPSSQVASVMDKDGGDPDEL